MPSAFRDKHGWIADFRGLHMRGKKRRRVRIPADRCATENDARAFAAESERLCRNLETMVDPVDVGMAVKMGSITPDEANQLLNGQLGNSNRLTIKAAHAAHPATRKEESKQSQDASRRSTDLELFCNRFKVNYVDEISLNDVQDWIAELKDESYDSRRHRLIPIRRACAMGARQGIPDPLYRLKIDSRPEVEDDIEVWTMDELIAAATAFSAVENRSALATVVLGGFMGLRPSEIARAKVGDVSDGILSVGARERKNRNSRRRLPIPPTALGLLRPSLEGQPAQYPIVPPVVRLWSKPGQHLHPKNLQKQIGPRLAALTGRSLTCGDLRKSCATWLIENGAQPRLVELWLGHVVSSISRVTSRHYLATLKSAELKPIAELLEQTLSTASFYKTA